MPKSPRVFLKRTETLLRAAGVVLPGDDPDSELEHDASLEKRIEVKHAGDLVEDKYAVGMVSVHARAYRQGVVATLRDGNSPLHTLAGMLGRAIQLALNDRMEQAKGTQRVSTYSTWGWLKTKYGCGRVGPGAGAGGGGGGSSDLPADKLGVPDSDEDSDGLDDSEVDEYPEDAVDPVATEVLREAVATALARRRQCVVEILVALCEGLEGMHEAVVVRACERALEGGFVPEVKAALGDPRVDAAGYTLDADRVVDDFFAKTICGFI
jgi:hypothetical protein